MDNEKYKEIYIHYEQCFEKYGDTNLGVDWPNADDANKRYKIMLDIVNYFEKKNYTILDFGAGCSALYNYILQNDINLCYSALDISSKYCSYIKTKYPNIDVYNLDILKDSTIPNFDFVVLNGVFTEKRNLSEDEMWNFLTQIIIKLFQKTNKGICFNIMTPVVDWKDDKLFYLSFDKLGKFLKENISRHFIINQSYGLWEYTIYVFKEPIIKTLKP
jgi:hypothetical protein